MPATRSDELSRKLGIPVIVVDDLPAQDDRPISHAVRQASREWFDANFDVHPICPGAAFIARKPPS